MTEIVLTVPPMNLEEAEQATAAIKRSVEDIRMLLFNVYTRRGWAAMGYESWHAYLTTEFQHHHHSYLRRQTHAALLEASVDPGLVGTHPESHMRPLIDILETDEERLEAYAMVDDHDEATAADFYRAAKYVYVNNRAPGSLGLRLVHGEIAINDAYDIMKLCERIEAHPPAGKAGESVYFTALAFMCNSPKLVEMLSQLDVHGDTWEAILASRTIPAFPDPIPIEEATAATLMAWLDVASAEHRAAAVEQNRELYERRTAIIDEILDFLFTVMEMDALRSMIPGSDRLQRLLGELERLNVPPRRTTT